MAAAAVATGMPGVSAGQAATVMPADRFTNSVGVNTHVMFHNTPYKDLDATIAALRWLGVRQVRDGVSAPAPPRGTWYRRDQQQRYLALGRAGVRLNLITGGPDHDGDTLSGRLALLRGLPAVTHVEGPNEWDREGGGDWAATLPGLQRRLHAAVKADRVLQARGVEVVGPSFGTLENAQQVGDLSGAMDIGNLHTYSGGRQPERAEAEGAQALPERLRLVRGLNGTRPLVITEVGFHNADRQPGRMPPTPPDVAALYTVRTVLEHARLGIRRTYLYELFDSYRDPLRVNAEAHFGLFTHDREPKPAATALRSLMRITRDRGASPSGRRLAVRATGAEDLRTLVLAKSRGRFAVAVWRATPVWDPELRQPLEVARAPVEVRLPRRFGDIRARRIAEADDPLERWRDRDSVTVGVGAAPVVIELSGRGGARPSSVHVPLPFL